MTSPLPFSPKLTDSRVDRPKIHMLEDILPISRSVRHLWGESGNDMGAFGRTQEEWLRTFLRLSGSVLLQN